MRSDEELKEIAKDLHAGRIFSDRHCRNPEEVRQVFMLINFLEEKQLKDMEAKEIDFFFEYLDKAGPMAVNGKPTFFSMQCLTKAESAKMIEYYDKIKAAVDAIV